MSFIERRTPSNAQVNTQAPQLQMDQLIDIKNSIT